MAMVEVIPITPPKRQRDTKKRSGRLTFEVLHIKAAHDAQHAEEASNINCRPRSSEAGRVAGPDVPTRTDSVELEEAHQWSSGTGKSERSGSTTRQQQ